MDKSHRHIFLYAKRHYKQEDQTEDLKIILGHRSNIDPEYISLADIISILIKLVWDYINSESQFIEFVLDVHLNNLWKFDHEYSEYDFDRALINKCLSVLSFQKIKDIPFDLGEPDPSILPLKSREIK